MTVAWGNNNFVPFPTLQVTQTIHQTIDSDHWGPLKLSVQFPALTLPYSLSLSPGNMFYSVQLLPYSQTPSDNSLPQAPKGRGQS